MMSFAVEAADLRVARGGREVLHGLNFHIPEGSIVGLLGPSGCGKTTLMRAIVGVQIISGGKVTVLEHPAGSPALRHRIGYSTQDPAVYADLTVIENMRYFASVLRAPRSDAERVIDEVGLTKQAGQVTATLSGGQLSRASLAVALLGQPELLVLDEPTVGLDPVLRNELWRLFQQLSDDGVTLVISSHVMDEAARCRRLLLMRDGEFLFDDTPDALRSYTGLGDMEQSFVQLIEEKEAIQV